MANGIGQRIVQFFLGLDEAVNGLDGGSAKETISGTIGRAAAKGNWFAVWIAQPVVNFGAYVVTLIVTGKGQVDHCQNAAAVEAKVRAATGGAA